MIRIDLLRPKAGVIYKGFVLNYVNKSFRKKWHFQDLMIEVTRDYFWRKKKKKK